MPIKGLTDRDSITPRFPRIGKLRKGGEKPDEKKPGPELEHWRFTSDIDGAERAFRDAYGDTPSVISVYLPYATVDANFQTWKEAWKSGGLDHRCDGQTCVVWLGDDGKYHREPKPCPGGCKEIGRLELIVPEMLQAGYVGTVTMETHSLNDLISITETLSKTAELRGDNPLGLRGILFNLRRVPEKISVPGFGQNAGKRQRVEKWLVKIEPAVDWVQAQMALTRVDAPALTMDTPAVDGEIVEPPTQEWSDEADAAVIAEFQARADRGEPNPPAAPKAEAPKVARPAPAETVRHWIRVKAWGQDYERPIDETDAQQMATQKQAQQIAALFGKAITWPDADESDLRKARVLTYQYIFGEAVTSGYDMTDREAQAVIDWMGGRFDPQEPALSEARFMYHAAQVDAGQQELDI